MVLVGGRQLSSRPYSIEAAEMWTVPIDDGHFKLLLSMVTTTNEELRKNDHVVKMSKTRWNT